MLTLWQICQMHVNMLEEEISHPARSFPLLVQLLFSCLIQFFKNAAHFTLTKMNRKYTHQPFLYSGFAYKKSLSNLTRNRKQCIPHQKSARNKTKMFIKQAERIFIWKLYFFFPFYKFSSVSLN